MGEDKPKAISSLGAGAAAPSIPASPQTGEGVGVERPERPELSEPLELRRQRPTFRLHELQTKHPEMLSMPIPEEILEVAEEIVSSCDSPGIEPSTLVLLLQVALYLDRQR